jgi:hypothetical protein
MKKKLWTPLQQNKKKNTFMMKIFTIDVPHNQMHNVHI